MPRLFTRQVGQEEESRILHAWGSDPIQLRVLATRRVAESSFVTRRAEESSFVSTPITAISALNDAAGLHGPVSERCRLSRLPCHRARCGCGNGLISAAQALLVIGLEDGSVRSFDLHDFMAGVADNTLS